MAKNTVTFSGNKIIPTLFDMTKVASKDVYGMQDFIVMNHENYLVLKKQDFAKVYTASNTIQIKNTGETGARFYYRLECADSDDGWTVVGDKNEFPLLLPRQRHSITLSSYLNTKTSQKDAKCLTKKDSETCFFLPISVWKEATVDEGLPTKSDSITFHVIIPKNVPIHSRIIYKTCLSVIDQTVVHPFFM
jgi:hypothetical protein